jgi:repressor LexA
VKLATPRQVEVLSVIAEHIRANGFPPTLRELGRKLKLSRNPTCQNVRLLEKKGLLQRKPTERAIRVTAAGWELLGVPRGVCPHCWATAEERTA